MLASYESVCLALTIPKDIEPPADGWPVVVYGHGTGGNFRAGVKLLASKLSELTDESSNEMGGMEEGECLRTTFFIGRN